jgi:hypothetical protein
MKIIKPIPASVEYWHNYVKILRAGLPKVLTGTFFLRPKPSEVFEYMRELANAQTSLWTQVRREFPEAISFPVQVTDIDVSWDGGMPEKSKE